MIHTLLESKLTKIRNYFQNNPYLKKFLPLIIGTIALFWFLIRVIPKPQRASYPCMKVAYPLMSGLVIWALGITGISASIKLLIKNIRNRKYLFAFGSVAVLILISFLHMTYQARSLYANPEYKDPVHIANTPFGVPQGIVPGRVVWDWNPDATNENCTNELKKNDGYFLNKNNNQEVIDKMMSEVIIKISDKKSEKEAWDAIFRYFNKQKGRGNNGYNKSQTVFVKINQGCASWAANPDLSRKDYPAGFAETSPQIILSVLKQLVNIAGVPQNKIIVADPLAHIYSDCYEVLHKAFPNVIYGDKSKSNIALGRTLLTPETTPVIFYSDKGTVLSEKSDCIYSEMQNAEYMINISDLKAHGSAGITLSAKNHFGSITRNSASHLHPGLIGSLNDRPIRTDYGLYRVQVDMMGSSYLGRNTLLYIVDGLWGGTEAIETPVKWVMGPFNNDWPNSIFVSLDQVALESVCFDFLRYETKIGSPRWKNRANMAQGVDDYLHQAASKEFWPKGIIYDPDNSGTPIPSLGVHEHWNNPVDKNYSGNMGKPNGIELVKILSGK